MNKLVQVLWIIIVGILTIFVVRTIHPNNSFKAVINDQSVQIGEDQLWVEVVLADEHNIYIRKGKEVVNEMPCSGGTDEEPTVMGIYYLQNRGEWFYSERFNEGALFWVRFYEQYLFHSVPVDKELNVIEEELEKIGKPASHGCIRLLEEDAEWFYYNVPDETLVIIHE